MGKGELIFFGVVLFVTSLILYSQNPTPWVYPVSFAAGWFSMSGVMVWSRERTLQRVRQRLLED